MKIKVFETIDSTNNYLKDKKEKDNWELVIAKKQTSGRGRRGNRWSSQEGGAWFSIALEEDSNVGMEEYKKLPLITGLAVQRVLQRYMEKSVLFKWTNDIYVSDKKVSGILIEKSGKYFIIGIGININQSKIEEFEEIATSIYEENGKMEDISRIVYEVVEELQNLYYGFLRGEWKIYLAEINSKNYLKDREVNVVQDLARYRGIAGEIQEDGRIEILIEGNKILFDIGEISLSQRSDKI